MKVGQMNTMDDKKRFPLLFKPMSGLLFIPSSDGDSERGFSVLRKVHMYRPEIQPGSLYYCQLDVIEVKL